MHMLHIVYAFFEDFPCPSCLPTA